MVSYTSCMAKKQKQVMPIDLDEMITLPAAAELLGFDQTYVRRLVLSGRILGFKFGRNYMVHRGSALSFQKTPGMGRPKVKK